MDFADREEFFDILIFQTFLIRTMVPSCLLFFPLFYHSVFLILSVFLLKIKISSGAISRAFCSLLFVLLFEIIIIPKRR